MSRLLSAHSLRTRLLWFVLAAIAVTAGIQALVAYRTARAEADDIFDFQMQQMAQSLSSGVPVSTALDSNVIDDGVDDHDFVVQVWKAGGSPVFQSARDAPPANATSGFSDVQLRGTTWRAFLLRSRVQTIQISQDMEARQEIAGVLALRIVGPIAVMALALLGLVWWLVTSSLAPVTRVSHQIAGRHADDLNAVNEAGLPDEVLPLVRELNLLFGRVRRAFEAQQSFVADAAHELRSPLAALKLQADALKRASDSAGHDLALGRLTAGIDRATRLVEQLLVLARHQSTMTVVPSFALVVLSELVRAAIQDALPLAQTRRIDLGLVRADEAVIYVHSDALKMLLANLLDNAIKYTPIGGTVDLAVQQVDRAVLLLVEDSGPGIPESERGRVLDRFYRIAGSDSLGSGLGLAIVQSIAQLHGATLTLEQSERLGGLKASVAFPAQPHGATARRRSGSHDV